MPSDVLVVCTGNVCRSPYVAARLAVELPDLTVVSAGTGALVGEQPVVEVQALLAEQGIATDGMVARSVDRAQVRGARLILTAARRHRVEISRLVPTAADRTYTVLELARVLRAEGEPRGIGLDGVLAAARQATAEDGGRDLEDDLDDPYRLSERHFIQMALDVETALGVLAPALSSQT